MLNVFCAPNATESGRRARRYATWLARALNAPLIDSLPLVPAGVIFVTHLPLEKAVQTCPPGAHLLLPIQEDGHRQAKAHGPICLPIGSRDLRPTALTIALAFAKQLKVGIVATHTTYRKRGVDRDESEFHTSAAALNKAVAVQDAAHECGVEVSVHFEMVNEIPDFVIGEAVKYRCGLIVMSRGNVVYGSNADRVATRTHLPILIIADNGNNHIGNESEVA